MVNVMRTLLPFRSWLVRGGACVLIGLSSQGCNPGPKPEAGDGGPGTDGSDKPQVQVKENGTGTKRVATTEGTKGSENSKTDHTPNESANTIDSRYLVNFEKAAISEDIPDGQLAPADKTHAGQITGKIRLAVEKMWPNIPLTDSKGVPISHVVSMETSAGTIEITLRPDIAPNHVRHFIALCKSNYYEGLHFDRVTHQEWEQDNMKKSVHVVKGGCPVGTWEDGMGHIGYWVKPEFSDKVIHEEGTVGIWHDESPESGGCRFYITLGPAPVMDGSFTILGKVSKGIEIVKTISNKPLQAGPEPDKPVQPIRIQKTTITPDPLEKSVPVAHNNPMQR